MRKKPVCFLGVLVACASVAVVSNSGCGRHADPMIVDGTIDCDEVNVSSKVPGRIKQLFVDEGTTVKPGDPIIVLESQEIDSRVDAATAAYEASVMRVAQAETAVKFQKATFIDQLDQAKAQYDARREDIRQAEEGLNQAKADYTPPSRFPSPLCGAAWHFRDGLKLNRNSLGQ